MVSSHLSALEIEGGLALTVYRLRIAYLQAFGCGFFGSFLSLSWTCVDRPLNVVDDTDKTSESAWVLNLQILYFDVRPDSHFGRNPRRFAASADVFSRNGVGETNVGADVFGGTVRLVFGSAGVSI